ncbi:hypothetical protein [Ravibacter arvi]|uniref:hypothetical protein n=1 Tax=Ravibacter arvi TaxID=2051041 RepID=UPI0031E87335
MNINSIETQRVTIRHLHFVVQNLRIGMGTPAVGSSRLKRSGMEGSPASSTKPLSEEFFIATGDPSAPLLFSQDDRPTTPSGYPPTIICYGYKNRLNMLITRYCADFMNQVVISTSRCFAKNFFLGMTDLIREFSATKVQRLGFIKFTSKYRKVFEGRGAVRMVLRGVGEPVETFSVLQPYKCWIISQF